MLMLLTSCSKMIVSNIPDFPKRKHVFQDNCLDETNVTLYHEWIIGLKDYKIKVESFK